MNDTPVICPMTLVFRRKGPFWRRTYGYSAQACAGNCALRTDGKCADVAKAEHLAVLARIAQEQLDLDRGIITNCHAQGIYPEAPTGKAIAFTGYRVDFRGEIDFSVFVAEGKGDYGADSAIADAREWLDALEIDPSVWGAVRQVVVIAGREPTHLAYYRLEAGGDTCYISRALVDEYASPDQVKTYVVPATAGSEEPDTPQG